MIIHDFDISTEPVVNIESFYGKQRKIVEKCLIIFSKVIHDYLLSSYDCSVIGEIGSCTGRIPIYSFMHEGEQIAFYLTGVGSAFASGTCYEAHWLTGATKFIMFGSCGSLDREKTFGRFIISTECYRGDGASYYYAPPSDYLPVRSAEKLSAGLVQKRKSEGCLAVEMELAGVEALCAFYGLELYNFLEAGDVLEESGYDTKELAGANHNLGKLMIALEIAKRI